MKKFFTLLLACSAIFSSQAQITIDNTDLPSGGGIFVLSNANNQDISLSDLAITGANQNWNFNLVSNSQQVDTTFNINQVPFVFQFTFFGSDYADRLAQDINLGTVSISDIYSFYNLSSSKLEQTGIGASISGIPTPILFNPKDVIYNFPLNYSDADVSDSHFEVTIPTIGQWIEDRNRVNTVDGWGTLQTPFGPKDVLRVKSEILNDDSVFIDLVGFGIKFPRQSVEYKWLGKNSGLPLLQVNTTVAFGNETVTQILFQDTLINTSIKDLSFSNSAIVYPQPANNSCLIAMNSNEEFNSLEVFDLAGRLVYSESNINKSFINISTTALSAGMYQVVLRSNKKTSLAKLTVQH